MLELPRVFLAYVMPCWRLETRSLITMFLVNQDLESGE